MGLGTWAIGGGPAWNGDLDRQICIDTILEAHRCGINLIDTAPGYNFGNSEVIVGQALKKLPREQVVVETKCGIVWERKGSLFNKVGDRQLYKNLSPESIREEVEASLQRLGIDYIDIYMTHWQSVPPFFTPIAETVAVLNELKAEGKIRAIGAANVDADHIREYLQYGELDIIQAKYSILDRAMENELLPLCRDNGIVVQVYSPLEQGLLTGTITRDYVPGGARANKVWFQRENMLKVIDMLEQWQPLCSVASIFRHLDCSQSFGQRTDLVEFDQDGVSDTFFDTFFQDLGVGYEQVVTNQLDFVAQNFGLVCETVPVRFVQSELAIS